MTPSEKQEILIRAKDFFRKQIVQNHISNTEKLVDLSQFNINPFLIKYLANFLTGNSNSESIAKALIYPRVLGTSITTTFGSQLQHFCSSVLEGYASTTSGIDIEFVDHTDNRRKYCQVKAGPNTINKDDVTTIKGHFSGVKNLARTNRQSNISLNDLIVGVFYGESHELSNNYKKINEDHPVYVGKEFWYRLTGEKDFYYHLISAVAEVANEADGKELLDKTIYKLSKQIEKEYKL